ncbi:MAG: hypothetical protein GX607_16230 [Myxococcales bacterium]|jgi:hypothetical protein|nr:hypothetical protein [Myxococcales bacterium]
MARSEQLDVLERGNIYFLVRPRVEEHDPEGPDDVQNLYVVLSPEGRKIYRSLIIGRAQLPDPDASGRQKHWGFVDAVYRDPKELSRALREETYSTKTRGERHRPAARPVGEGVYEIASHKGHTHLSYALELPEQPGEVQGDLGIEAEASYVVSVKNPDQPSPPRMGLKREVHLPQHLKEAFGGRKFADADPPELLDHEGVEVLLVAATSDLRRELGSDLPGRTQEENRSSADIFRDLRLRASKHPVEPLFEGRWA